MLIDKCTVISAVLLRRITIFYCMSELQKKISFFFIQQRTRFKINSKRIQFYMFNPRLVRSKNNTFNPILVNLFQSLLVNIHCNEIKDFIYK